MKQLSGGHQAVSDTLQVAQWVRALAALAEDPGSNPSTHMGISQPPVQPTPWDKMSFSGHHGHLLLCAHTSTQMIQK